MQFATGQLIVHPQHGPCTVTGFRTRVVGKVKRRYIELHVERTDLNVSVPEDGAEDIGLRPVFDREQLQELESVLLAPSLPLEKQWSRRMKANQDLLASGDLMKIALVVRDLVRRQHGSGISAAEKDLLKQARRPILGELVESLSLTDDEAERLLDGLILGEITELPPMPVAS